jgi:hypothetical protein
VPLPLPLIPAGRGAASGIADALAPPQRRCSDASAVATAATVPSRQQKKKSRLEQSSSSLVYFIERLRGRSFNGGHEATQAAEIVRSTFVIRMFEGHFVMPQFIWYCFKRVFGNLCIQCMK